MSGEAQSSRVIEVVYGLRRFAEAPVLGKGLGFPIPAAINRFGLTEPEFGSNRRSDTTVPLHFRAPVSGRYWIEVHCTRGFGEYKLKVEQDD